jgi:cobalamin synthase
MTGDGALLTDGPGRVSAMRNWRYIGLHAVAAASFIFLLQRYAMKATFESSLLWALIFGACAAALAYSQSKR